MVTNPALRLQKNLGSNAAIAEHFKISREAARLWMKNGVPTDRALEVEELTAKMEDPITADEVLRFARERKKAA